MKILITYNQPPAHSSRHYACHGEVLEQVEDVQTALKELGHKADTLSIGKNIKEELEIIIRAQYDLIFNLCESILESSKLQASFAGFLELMGIPFTGSGTEGILTAVNKFKAKTLLLSQGIPAPDGWLIREGEEPTEVLPEIPLSSYPVIIKPNMEDGSIGLSQSSIAEGPHELKSILNRYEKEYTGDTLIEQYIAGKEFNVGFLGRSSLKSLPVAEIRFRPSFPGHYKFLSYDAKWREDSPEFGQYERISPPSIPQNILNQITQFGEAAYKTIGLSGYGRVDFRMDSLGNVYVIDVNANPDLSRSAGLAKGAQDKGLSYATLIQEIIECPFCISANRHLS